MDFDAAALTWDDSPVRRERSLAASVAIRESLAGRKRDLALEFGCGPGLLGFNLRDFFGKLYMVDTSRGMIEVLKGKIERAGIANMVPMEGDLNGLSFPEGRIDAIFTLMALHHVKDIEGICTTFSRLTGPGGSLRIIDLVKEDGSFHRHEPGFEGHNGFDVEELGEILIHAGFASWRSEIVYENVRETETGKRVYPVFLLSADK
jgi:ubiquinone/menaquinone biosynthesis C-methylase UbiE